MTGNKEMNKKFKRWRECEGIGKEKDRFLPAITLMNEFKLQIEALNCVNRKKVRVYH